MECTDRNSLCANPKCLFLVHTDASFGGFCCKKCHWCYTTGSGTKKNHGRQCERRDAPVNATRAAPLAPANPIVHKSGPAREATEVVADSGMAYRTGCEMALKPAAAADVRSARIVDGAGQADPLIGQEMKLFGLDDHPYYNGICAVDADAIGHFAKTGCHCPAGESLDTSRLLAAVRGMRDAGLNVILVSQHDLAPVLQSLSCGDTGEDVSGLMCIRAASDDTSIDLLRVARDYLCPFVTNADMLSLETSRRVPPFLRRWLQDVRVQPLPPLPPDLPKLQVIELPGDSGMGRVDGSEQGLVFCLECEKEKMSCGIFPFAMEMADSVASPEQVREDFSGHRVSLVRRALETQGLSQWAEGLFTFVSVVSGRNRGLCAVGCGTNKKARTRAARVALAVAARVPMPLRGVQAAEDPSGDGTFPELVRQAKRLLDSNRSGRPVWEPKQLAPAVHAQDAAMPESELNASFAARKISEGNLNGRIVEALATYNAEGDGYLHILKGDRLKICFERREPGGARDHFRAYVYGAHLDAALGTYPGWFPYDICRIVN